MKTILITITILLALYLTACQKEKFLVSELNIASEAQKSDLKSDSKTKGAKTLIAKNWGKVAHLKPRHSHTSLVFDGKVWIIAGKGDGDIPYNDVLYSTNGKNWETATAKAPFRARFHHSSTVFNGRMWVVGGLAYDPSNNDNQFYGNWEQVLSENPFHNHFYFTNGYSALNDVWSSSDGIKWERVIDKANFPARYSHSVTAFNGALWLMGGISDDFGNLNGPGRFYTDIWKSYDGKNWVKVEDETTMEEISRHTALVFENRLWVLGDDFQSDEAIWSSKNGKEWEYINYPLPLGGSIFHQVLTADKENLWCFGFDLTSQLGSDMMYSSDGLNWSKAALDKPFKNRIAHSSVFFKGKLWMINGWWHSGASDKTNDGWKSLSDIWSFEEPITIDDIIKRRNRSTSQWFRFLEEGSPKKGSLFLNKNLSVQTVYNHSLYRF